MKEITHHYVICLQKLTPEWGDGFKATIPQLGNATFVGSGETPEEALESLQILYGWIGPGGEAEIENFDWPEPKDDDWIEFKDENPDAMTPDEVDWHFRKLLAEAERRLKDRQ